MEDSHMTDARDEPGGDTRTPRWVKVAGIITAVVVLLFVVLMLMGGHEPGRHFGAGSTEPSLVPSLKTS
jgi:hypothetical protein